MPEFEALRSLWTPHEHLKAPPLEPINLWGEGGVGIWVSNDWGPAVPYSGVDHRDGNINHGYRPMKGNEAAIRFIPEVQGWPEMQKFLETINAESSPIESVGCEKGIFPSDVEGLQIKLGSYVDVIFTEAVLNDRPDNFLLLATFLANAIEG
ncbi:MAG: hypothetical protein ACREQ5_04845, partial [Candidatus Dormibacteria bacterium]